MIKLQDFAKERGVTDRQVQRLLQKYASEVEGLFQRKGPNGTWLTEEACEILRSKMKSNPVSNVVDTREVDELKQKLAEAEEKIKSKEQYITALEAGNLRQQERLNELENNQLLLEEAEKKTQNAQKELVEAHEKFELELKRREEQYTQELEAEKNRKLTFVERLFGRKIRGKKNESTGIFEN